MTVEQMWLGALVCLALTYGLTLVETALSQVSRRRVDEAFDSQRPGSSALLEIADDLAPHLAVLAFLRIGGEATSAVLVTLALTRVLDGLWPVLLTAVAVMTLVSFVVVGVSPRTLGRQHAAGVALWSAPAVRAVSRVARPVARGLVLLGNAVTPGRGYAQGPFDSEADLREMVDIAGDSALIEAGEREMIHSIFELGDTTTREVMVPRTDMVAIDHGKTLRQAMSLFLRSGFSRVPVTGEGGADEVLGMLYFKDVVRRTNADASAREGVLVTDVMREVSIVPETKRADDLLRQMQAEQMHIALVIDEYGGTAGLVTIEYILDEIVGEITDEHDRDEAEPEEIAPGEWRVPASLPAEDLGDLFDVTFEERDLEDIDTVGGLLAKAVGMVPIAGSQGAVRGLSLTAERMAGRRHRVTTVLVRRLTLEEMDSLATDGEPGPGPEPGTGPLPQAVVPAMPAMPVVPGEPGAAGARSGSTSLSALAHDGAHSADPDALEARDDR